MGLWLHWEYKRPWLEGWGTAAKEKVLGKESAAHAALGLFPWEVPVS